MTPVKRKKVIDHRNTEIQKTPKGKVSKSKLISKLNKNKLIIDFDTSKNQFQSNDLAQIFEHGFDQNEEDEETKKNYLYGDNSLTNMIKQGQENSGVNFGNINFGNLNYCGGGGGYNEDSQGFHNFQD